MQLVVVILAVFVADPFAVCGTLCPLGHHAEQYWCDAECDESCDELHANAALCLLNEDSFWTCEGECPPGWEWQQDSVLPEPDCGALAETRFCEPI